MAQLIKMPAVAADSATGSIAQWLKKEGDRVAVGDPIAEIETDKAIVEIAAEHAGVLARIVAASGDAQLPVNAVLAVLTADGDDAAAIDRALAAAGEQGADRPAAAPAVDATPADGNTGRLFSSPAARRIAADHQIDLRQIAGSGPRGRILKHDVERVARAEQRAPAVRDDASAQAPSQATGAAGEASGNAAFASQRPAVPTDLAHAGTRTPHSNMRRAIARRLTESKTTIPHFYLTLDCRMDALLALRRQIRDDGEVRVSVNDFIVRAAALTLIAVPEVNVSWDDDALIQHGSADVAVAVATEGGLVTPIVRQAHTKTLRHVAAEIAALADRGRAQRLTPQEYTGGSMTVSNLGMYGVTQFAAIINPPQASILAVGAAEKRAVADDADTLSVATVMTVTLSADHRAIDGAVAARWLAAFKQLIEHPVRILL